MHVSKGKVQNLIFIVHKFINGFAFDMDFFKLQPHFPPRGINALIVASADFILTSNEVNKNDKPSQLLKFFWLLPHIFVEFTTKIRHITLQSSNGGAGRHR